MNFCTNDANEPCVIARLILKVKFCMYVTLCMLTSVDADGSLRLRAECRAARLYFLQVLHEHSASIALRSPATSDVSVNAILHEKVVCLPGARATSRIEFQF
jgi:hypothetical protein